MYLVFWLKKKKSNGKNFVWIFFNFAQWDKLEKKEDGDCGFVAKLLIVIKTYALIIIFKK